MESKGKELALRPAGKAKPRRKKAHVLGPGDRSGVLEQPVQQGPRPDDRRALFTLLCLQYLVRNSGPDAVALAVRAASKAVGLSEQEEKEYRESVLKQAGTFWPAGFM